MSSNKLLIIGDSFSASTNQCSWAESLNNFLVTNLSTSGSSEYRILKKLENTILSEYSYIIIVHTSPYRIFIDNTPIHRDSQTHQNCDLIYQDVKSASQTEFTKNVSWYFEHIFNLEQANDMHRLIVKEIIELTKSHHTIHITFFEDPNNLPIINLHSIWKMHPGAINHLDKYGNKKVADFVNSVYNKTHS